MGGEGFLGRLRFYLKPEGPIGKNSARHVAILTQVRVSHAVRPNKWKRRSVEQRKVYCMARQGGEVAQALKSLPEGFRQSILKARRGVGGRRARDQLVHSSLIG